MSAFSFMYLGGYNRPVNAETPFTLTCNVAAGAATLSWSAQTGAIDYVVYGGLEDEPLVPLFEPQTGVSANISGLATGKVYAFLVVARLGDKQCAVSTLQRGTA